MINEYFADHFIHRAEVTFDMARSELPQKAGAGCG